MNWKIPLIAGVVFLVFLSPALLTPALAQIGPGPISIESKTLNRIVDIVSKPKISLVHGTEYSPGVKATVFLQIINESDQSPINDGACYIDIYYPDKSAYYSDSLMTYLAGSDGLYYFDIAMLPNTTGVYMISAYCYVPANIFMDEFDDYSKLEAYDNITVSGGKAALTEEINETVTLVAEDTENMNDAWVNEKFSSLNYGTAVLLYVANDTDRKRTYMMYNLTDIAGADISELCIFSAEIGTEGNVSISHVFESNWDEDTITWDNQPCGLEFDNATACNATPMDTLEISPQSVWHCFDVTPAVQIELAAGNQNVSFAFRMIDDNTEEHFGSKETIEKKPYLNTTVFIPSYAQGFIRSNPIYLPGNRWVNFMADYVLNEGGIDFKVLNSSNEVICNGLGDISACANSISPIKLYADISRPFPENASPELNEWWATWSLISYEIVRGSGEIHISTIAESVSIYINASIDHIASRVWKRFLMLGTPPIMESTSYYCIDNDFLMKNISFVFCEDSKCEDIEKAEPILCNYGCKVGRCLPNPADQNIMVFGVIGSACLILLFLVWMSRRKGMYREE